MNFIGKHCLVVVLIFGIADTIFAQIDTLDRPMLPMSATTQRPHTTTGSIYSQRGATDPFTGVLYGRYANGNYLSMQEYDRGIGNGRWMNYYEDGTVQEIGTYRDNRTEGPIRQYYANGNLRAEGTYAHWRKKVGTWRYYNEAGELVKMQEENGTLDTEWRRAGGVQ